MSITDKVLASMANLHFYNMSMGTIVDLSIVFHRNFVLNCAHIYPVQVAIATCDEYLADEPEKY